MEKEIKLNESNPLKLDTKIENFGDKNYNTLYIVKDEKESSPEINFVGNTNNEKIAYKLELEGDFKAGDKGNHQINLCISEPQEGNSYKLYLYIRENIDGPNLFKPKRC